MRIPRNVSTLLLFLLLLLVADGRSAAAGRLLSGLNVFARRRTVIETHIYMDPP